MYIRPYTYIHTEAHGFIIGVIQTYTHTYIQTYTHTHVRIYIHTEGQGVIIAVLLARPACNHPHPIYARCRVGFWACSRGGIPQSPVLALRRSCLGGLSEKTPEMSSWKNTGNAPHQNAHQQGGKRDRGFLKSTSYGKFSIVNALGHWLFRMASKGCRRHDMPLWARGARQR